MKCWYCGKAEMVEENNLPKGWEKCLLCGATHIPIPKIGASPVLDTLSKEGMAEYSFTPRKSRKGVKNATSNTSLS